jgi:hypothetical protein
VKRKILSIFSLATIFIALMVSPVFAISQWDHTIIGQSVGYTWSETEEGPGGEYYFVYFPTSLQGNWQEWWQGTPNSYASLGTLYLAGEVTFDSMNLALDITPDATYNNSNYYYITTYYTWILHSSDEHYAEGYTNPWVQYNSASVNSVGHVNFYNPDTNEISYDIYYSWNNHSQN